MKKIHCLGNLTRYGYQSVPTKKMGMHLVKNLSYDLDHTINDAEVVVRLFSLFRSPSMMAKCASRFWSVVPLS